MNNIKKWMLLLVIPVAATSIANAQTLEQVPTYSSGTGTGKVKINLLYNYSLPMGTFKNDLIKNNSPRGFSVDVLYWFKPQWGVGGSFGFQDYYQKNPRDVYKLSDGSDISAVLTHSVKTLPILAKAMYMPNAANASIIQPYVSAGAGINFVNFSEYLGEFSSANKTNGKFTTQAGAGVKVALGKNDKAGFLLGATYNYTPYNQYDINNISALNLQAGFQFKLK